MTRISKDFEEKKVQLLGRGGREAPRCRPGGTFLGVPVGLGILECTTRSTSGSFATQK